MARQTPATLTELAEFLRALIAGDRAQQEWEKCLECRRLRHTDEGHSCAVHPFLDLDYPGELSHEQLLEVIVRAESDLATIKAKLARAGERYARALERVRIQLRDLDHQIFADAAADALAELGEDSGQ